MLDLMLVTLMKQMLLQLSQLLQQFVQNLMHFVLWLLLAVQTCLHLMRL